MSYTEFNDIPGLLMLIDFEKAFDTVSWDLIFQILTFFNFGVSIKKWIKCFYQNISSCVIQNGILSKYFNPQRGCRQGDPVSPYLFILCTEILGILIQITEILKELRLTEKNIRYHNMLMIHP